MSPRVSSRLAAREASSVASDKENSPLQISSLPATPAPPKGKSVARKRATPNSRTLAIRGKAKAEASPVKPQSVSKPAKSAVKTQNAKTEIKDAEVTLPEGQGTKRKRAVAVSRVEEGDDELPHNMGKRTPAKAKENRDTARAGKSSPRKRTAAKPAKKEDRAQDAKEVVKGAEAAGEVQGPPKKKARKANPYGLTPGQTPFPDWPHPTIEECYVVHDLLMNTIKPERRKKFVPPDDIPAPSEVVAGCGEVPSILDALIRTLLSAATNGQNSSNAFQGLVKRFGLATVGVGKGSVDWNAVNEASLEDVFDAIKCGGLAERKSANIKKILAMVHAENQERLAALLNAEEAGEPTAASKAYYSEKADEEEKAEREVELRVLQQGVLTLDYYHHLEKDDALSTFTNYPGVGVKTAACINLFCMQRPCFAVDTHVFRLCQYLGWVPPDETRVERQKKADRNTTFSHCEVRIPDELKYGLHQLFLEHGKNCPRCRAVTGETSDGWADANCVIEHLVKRLGAKKGGVDSPRKKVESKKGMKDDKNDDEALSEQSGNEQSSEADDFVANPNRARVRNKKPTSPKKIATPKKEASPAAKAAKPVKAGRATKAKAAKVTKPRSRNAKAAKDKKMMKAEEITEEEDAEMSDLTDEVEPEVDDED